MTKQQEITVQNPLSWAVDVEGLPPLGPGESCDTLPTTPVLNAIDIGLLVQVTDEESGKKGSAK